MLAIAFAFVVQALAVIDSYFGFEEEKVESVTLDYSINFQHCSCSDY